MAGRRVDSRRDGRRAQRRHGIQPARGRADGRAEPANSSRELPRGAMSGARGGDVRCRRVGRSSSFAAWQLNPLCFALSPVALAIVFWYSLAKRYTTWTQLFLGLAMAVAPVGGWLAVGGRGGWEPWLLALAIGTWVGGFDVLYACQDLDFDRAHGLRSIPVRFGIRGSLVISRALHVVTIVCLASLPHGHAARPRVLRRRRSSSRRCWCTSSRSCAPTICRR